ncbi:MAG: NUDIX hydrolase [Chloroflexi bacterium]|nr:NUDIX hydrolase [Chloroflexota bacterium]MBU1659838.1 NUDIX hydrolase [Chloroflexota bacterium]
MKTTKKNLDANVIEAAGGLLWNKTPKGRKLALIHREGYDDWTLPKGKREPGESWQETALREVWEETGCQAQLESFAGSTAYVVEGVAKVVLFWNMTPEEGCKFEPNPEVDKMEWLSPKKALKRMSYEGEREVVRKQELGNQGSVNQ